MKKLILSILIYIPIALWSQTGGVYISNYELNNRAEKWSWAISQDQDNIMLLGVANGVVVFDGLNESFIKLPFTPLSIKNDGNDNFWVTGYKNIGLLSKTGFSSYEYKSVSVYDDYEFNEVLLHNASAYVLSSSLILKFGTDNTELTDSIFIEDGLLNETFILNDKLYFIIDYFLYTIEDGKLVENLTADFPVDEFAYTVNISDTEVLLGTNENTFYIFNGKSFKTRTIKKSAYFDNNLVVKGEQYNDSLIVLSSLAGGIALFDFSKREVIKQISYFNGLADDEIRTFYIDKQQCIWTSHEFGISRLDFNIGIENYSYYPGLKGNPLAATFFENNIFIATSDGLFKLSEIKNYDEFTVSVNVPVNVTVEVPVETKVIEEVTTSDESPESKGVFGFLSKKKKGKQQEQKSTQQSVKTVTTTKKEVVKKSKTKKIRKRSLKSVSHYYTLVKGVSDKCTKLIHYSDYLLVAGNNGLYTVKGDNSKKIISAYINDIYQSDDLNQIYVSTNNGIYTVSRKANDWEIDHFAQTTSINILSLAYEKNNEWVLGLDNMVIRAKLDNKEIEILQKTELNEAAGMTYFVKNIDNQTKIFTSNTVYNYSDNGELTIESENNNNSYYLSNQIAYTWKYENDEWRLLGGSNQLTTKLLSKLRLYSNIRYIDVNTNGDLWIVNEDNTVLKIAKETDNYQAITPALHIKKLNSKESNFELNSIVDLSPNDNTLWIKLSTPFYFKQNGVKFRSKVEGMQTEWSNWVEGSTIQISYIPAGSFNLIIQSIDEFGNLTESDPIKIKVAKPFTQTAAFIILIIVIVIAAVYAFFRIRLIKLKKDKEILEQKVKERTKTIEDQKSRIEKQHDEITQSIRYAKRIQTAMLPHDEIIEAMLPNHFILFMPRDIVSGDFYFFKPIGNKVVFVAADCTGHGVPGGFMSMLGISYLSEITSQVKDPSAGEILNHLREKIKITLGQTDTDSTQKDGMDLAICVIDTDKNQLQYSGAFNPLYIMRNNELEVVKADRQPVAVYFKEHEFTNHIIDVKKGDTFYMFSDGFPDQIGGPKQRKFMTKNFKQLLIDNHKLPMQEQHKKLKNTITQWQGDAMQVDDILVVGFRI